MSISNNDNKNMKKYNDEYVNYRTGEDKINTTDEKINYLINQVNELNLKLEEINKNKVDKSDFENLKNLEEINVSENILFEYPYTINPINNGYIEVKIEGNTKILNSNNEEDLSGKEENFLVSVGNNSEISIYTSNKNLFDGKFDTLKGTVVEQTGTLIPIDIGVIYSIYSLTKTGIRICLYDKDKKIINFGVTTPKLLPDVISKVKGVGFYCTNYNLFASNVDTNYEVFKILDDRVKYISLVYRNITSINMSFYKGECEEYTPSIQDIKILKYYNENGDIVPILNLARINDTIYDSIEKHNDGKYYYHKRCEQILLNNMNITPQSDSNQIEGFYTGYLTKANIPILEYVKPNSICICDKIQCKGIWNTSKALKEEFIAIHANSSLNIRLNTSKVKNKEEMNIWINTNKPIVIFELLQEQVYECVNLDIKCYEKETNFNVISGKVSPIIKFKLQSNLPNIVNILDDKTVILQDNINELENKNNSYDKVIASLNLINSIYISQNKTLVLNDISENTDISEIVNNALLLEDVIRVVLPVGNFLLSKTIEVPSNKKLVLQGSYKDNKNFYSTSPRTKLKLTTPNISMIKLKKASILEGGYLNLGENINSQGIRLDFWEEGHEGTKVIGTMILGSKTRLKNQTGVLMECDSYDGIKNGYGVYCDFDIAMYSLGIGYHLHRQNATWQDKPNEVVWMTDCYFKGNITHCNRYIWFDTIGGWCGDSSRIEATIQCGSIVGEDYPGIEIDCYGTQIIGTLWDFGGDGLQQNAIKLNTKSKSNLIIGEKDRRYIIDEGKNNIVFSDLINNTNNTLFAKDIISPKLNSFTGNEEKLKYNITVFYKDGRKISINNIFDLDYSSDYGYKIEGVTRLECLFRQYESLNYKDLYTTIDTSKVDKVEIEIEFSSLVSLFDVGLTCGEVYLPEYVGVYAFGKGEWHECINKKFNTTDGSYTSEGVIVLHENLISRANSRYKYDLMSKQEVVKKIKYIIQGKLENTLNTANAVKFRELMANIEGIRPNFNDRYIYDYDNLDVLYTTGNRIFGECILNIDFSKNISSINLDDIFYINENISKEIVDGKLIVKNNSEKQQYFNFKGYYKYKIAIIDFEYNLNSLGTIYYMNNNLSYKQVSGRKLFITNNSNCIILFQKKLEEDEYIKINRIKVYNLPISENNIFYPEIVDKFMNYFGL